MKNTEERFLMGNLRNFPILRRRYAAFDLQQQKYQTDAQQDVSDPGHAGNGRVHTGGKRSFEHLSHAPHNKHDSRQVQADVIDHKNPPGFSSGEGKAFLQQQQKQEKTIPSRK